MTSAFLYLTFRTMWNQVRMRVQRLRQPRYLIATVVGGCYFYFVVFRAGHTPSGRSTSPLAFIARYRAALEVGLSTALFLFVALAWVLPRSERPALAFSRAEVQFLFPAPISRRELIQYKLLRWIVAAPITSAIMTFFFRPSTAARGWTFFLAVSLFMITLNLHMTGVSLSRESLRTHGSAGLARQWLPLVLVLVAAAILGGSVAMDWPQLAAFQRPGDLVAELQRLGTSGAAAVVLWPFRQIVKLVLATSPSELLPVLPAAAGLLVANFLWVVRSDASFEEAAAARAEKSVQLTHRRAPIAYRVRRPPFALALTGRPEVAIFWKNLVVLGRFASGRMLLVLLPGVVFFGIIMAGEERGTFAETLGWFCAFAAIMTILLGPHMVRNDLRHDLARLEILKTWPISGVALVRGELLAPLAVLSVIVWVLMVATLALAPTFFSDVTGVSVGAVRLPVAILLVGPGLMATQLATLNGIAVVFPGLVRIGTTRVSGVEVFGQRLIMMAALLLVIAVAALPAGVVFVLVALALGLVTEGVAIVLPAVAASGVLFLEAVLATALIGRALDRTTPADVDVRE